MTTSSLLLSLGTALALARDPAPPAPSAGLAPSDEVHRFVFHPRKEKREEVEFRAWLDFVLGRIELSPLADLLGMDYVRSQMPVKDRIHYLAQEIASSDSKLRAYLALATGVRAKSGRLSSMDRRLLHDIRLKLANKLQDSRVGLDFRDFADQNGVTTENEAEAMGVGFASEAPKDGAQGYNPESGIWERFDAKSKAWVTMDPQPK